MLHVVPFQDSREHYFEDCWCEPTIEYIDPDTGLPYNMGPLATHNSADGREEVEARGEDGGGWGIVDEEGNEYGPDEI